MHTGRKAMASDPDTESPQETTTVRILAFGAVKLMILALFLALFGFDLYAVGTLALAFILTGVGITLDNRNKRSENA